MDEQDLWTILRTALQNEISTIEHRTNCNAVCDTHRRYLTSGLSIAVADRVLLAQANEQVMKSGDAKYRSIRGKQKTFTLGCLSTQGYQEGARLKKQLQIVRGTSKEARNSNGQQNDAKTILRKMFTRIINQKRELPSSSLSKRDMRYILCTRQNVQLHIVGASYNGSYSVRSTIRPAVYYGEAPIKPATF